MNINDALSILKLNKENETYSRDEVKKVFRKLINQYHPDKEGGDVHFSQLLNQAWESLRKFDQVTFTGEADGQSENLSEVLKTAIDQIKNLDGLNIEICGTWIWVTGETKRHKEKLKESKFFYSKNKTAWYFKTGTAKRRGSSKSLDDIRESHGSQVVKRNYKKRLAA